MALMSMTGFGAAEGRTGALRWRWELRSVNARGLDLRLRTPPGREELEPPARAELQKRLTRGTVSAHLSLAEEVEGGLDPVALARAAAQTAAARRLLEAMGLPVAPISAEAVAALALRPDGLGAPNEEGRAAERAALVAGFVQALEALARARADEGARLAGVIEGQIAKIEALAQAAEGAAFAAQDQAKARLQGQLATLLENRSGLDETRLAQELALIAVKSDAREEIDRLKGHVAAARAMLAEGAGAGRKLDFLAQEFNREANTLCAKASSAELTRIGLDLKLIIDQLREQAQNVE